MLIASGYRFDLGGWGSSAELRRRIASRRLAGARPVLPLERPRVRSSAIRPRAGSGRSPASCSARSSPPPGAAAALRLAPRRASSPRGHAAPSGRLRRPDASERPDRPRLARSSRLPRRPGSDARRRQAPAHPLRRARPGATTPTSSTPRFLRRTSSAARALPPAVSRSLGMLEGQMLKGYPAASATCSAIVAFADRIGLELALLFKLTRIEARPGARLEPPQCPRQAALPASPPRPVAPQADHRLLQRPARPRRRAVRRLPREKLHVELQPVDERFLGAAGLGPRESSSPQSDVCSSGLSRLPDARRSGPRPAVRVELAVGNLLPDPAQQRRRAALIQERLPRESAAGQRRLPAWRCPCSSCESCTPGPASW